MANQTQTKTASQQSLDLEQKVQKLRQLYADATDIAKSALENVIHAPATGAIWLSVNYFIQLHMFIVKRPERLRQEKRQESLLDQKPELISHADDYRAAGGRTEHA